MMKPTYSCTWPGSHPRSRLVLGVCTALVIGLGLASRRTDVALFPAVLGKYPGDALWAMMVWLGGAMIWPRASAGRLGLGAMLTATAVELSQLYKTPWLDALRGTTLGHLVLGTTFAWHDIVAYAVGIAVGMAIDMLIGKINFVFSLNNTGGSHV